MNGLLVKYPQIQYFKGLRDFAKGENERFIEYVANLVKVRFLLDELLLGACESGKRDIIHKLYQGTNIPDKVIITLYRSGYGFIVSELNFTFDVSLYIAAGELVAGVLKNSSRSIDVLNYLLQNNIPLPLSSVEFISDFKDYALHFAAMRDYRSVISLLSNGERNTDVSITAAKFGHLETAFHYMTEASYPIVVDEIIKRGDIKLFHNLGVLGYEAALSAIKYKQLQMFNYIITQHELMNNYNFITALVDELVKVDNLDYLLKINGYTMNIDKIIRTALRHGSITILNYFMKSYNDTYLLDANYDSTLYLLNNYNLSNEVIQRKLKETTDIDIIRFLCSYVKPSMEIVKFRMRNNSSLQVIHALLFNNITTVIPQTILDELITYSQDIDRPELAFMLSQHK